MTSKICDRCGAELAADARFCRRCGQPTATFEGTSVTEAETRVFEATSERAQPTQYYDQRPTGPSYMSPVEMYPPQAAATTKALSAVAVKKNRAGILLGSALVVLAIISLTLFAAWKWGGSSSSATPPTIAKPGVPQVPQVPQPPAPPAPGAGQGSTSALVYPGAQVTMEMTRGREGSVRHLTTTDSFEKVVAWYTEKLKPIEDIRTPEPTAILRGDGITAIIAVEDGETQILLQQGIDRN